MKKSRFQARLKNTLFFECLQKIKQKPGSLGMIVIFDILFLLCLFLLQQAFNIFIPTDVARIVELFGGFILVVGLGYYLLSIFLYSLFGYLILHYVKSFVKKEKFTFKYLGKYFLLNLFIFFLGFICMIIVNLGAKAMRPEYLRFYFWAVMIPALILFLIYVFISHALFIENKKIKEVILDSFRVMFAQPETYLGFLAGDLVLGGLLGIILLGIWIIGIVLAGAESMIMDFVSGILILLFLYSALIVNRIMFYLAVQGRKKKS